MTSSSEAATTANEQPQTFDSMAARAAMLLASLWGTAVESRVVHDVQEALICAIGNRACALDSFIEAQQDFFAKAKSNPKGRSFHDTLCEHSSMVAGHGRRLKEIDEELKLILPCLEGLVQFESGMAELHAMDSSGSVNASMDHYLSK